MSTRLLWFAALFAVGCGSGDSRQPKRPAAYPALDDLSPPPALPSEEDGRLLSDPFNPPAEVDGEGWVRRREVASESVEGLRAYATSADADDPFALTEEELEALAKRDDLALF